MLVTNKTVQLAAESQFDGQTVMQLNATVDVNDGVKLTYSEFIINQDLYREHKTDVRKDIEDFRNVMYDIEDSENAGLKKDEEPVVDPETEGTETGVE